MPNLVNLRSSKGRALLRECQTSEGCAFQPFQVAVFSKETDGANCGIQSAALVMAAHQLGRDRPSPGNDITPIPKDQQPITEESMFDYEATTNVMTQADVHKCGTDLDQVTDILRNHGYQVLKCHAADSSVDRFRQDAIEALMKRNSSSGVIVNYFTQELGQLPPFGHHSPLAAYHEAEDRFLLMDVCKDLEECWAKSEDLYKAMNTVDGASVKTRGYCVIHASTQD